MTYKEQSNIQVPSIYHKKIGEVTVTVISDGGLQLPFWPYYELEEEKGTEILNSNFQDSPPYLNTNCFVVNINGRLILIDTGVGSILAPMVGHLKQNLTAAGISPEDIDTVLLTHIHPDHTNGMINADGTKAFPNAEVVVNYTEYNFWMDETNMSQNADEIEKGNFMLAKAALTPYESSIRTFSNDESEPVHGIKAIEAPGHTPGHTAYLIESNGDKLLIWGDIIHNATLQLLRPDEKVAMDYNPVQAVTTRKRILDLAANERLLVSGMHLDFPGFRHIKKEGNHYVQVLERWKTEL
ncbi:MBL fold metallo-hydrolase [Priestia megaterium]